MTGRADAVPAGSAAASAAQAANAPPNHADHAVRDGLNRLEARSRVMRKRRSRFTDSPPWRGSRLLRGTAPFRVWRTRGRPRALSRKPRCVPVRSWPRRLRRRADPSHGGRAVRSFSGDSIRCGTASGSPSIPAEIRTTGLRRQDARRTVGRPPRPIADRAFGNIISGFGGGVSNSRASRLSRSSPKKRTRFNASPKPTFRTGSPYGFQPSRFCGARR